MRFLKDILGISTLEDKIEEIYRHYVRANAHTHSCLFEQKDMLKTLIEKQTAKVREKKDV